MASEDRFDLFWQAVINKDTELIDKCLENIDNRSLWRYMCQIQSEGWNSLSYASLELNDEGTLRHLLDKLPPQFRVESLIGQRDRNGYNILHAAVVRKCGLKVLQCLIDSLPHSATCYSLITDYNVRGDNSLHTAACLQEVDIMVALLANIPEERRLPAILSTNDQNLNCLHLALVQQAPLKFVKCLFQPLLPDERQLAIQGRGGFSCIEYLAKNPSQIEVLNYLLSQLSDTIKYDAIMHVNSALGRNLLHIVIAEHADMNVVRCILSHLSIPNARNEAILQKCSTDGSNCILKALRTNGDIDLFDYLLAQLASRKLKALAITDKDYKGVNCLQGAIEARRNVNILRKLLSHLSSEEQVLITNAINKDGMNAVHAAIGSNGNVAFTKYLLERMTGRQRAAVLSARSFTGNSCLHSALRAENFSKELIHVMLERFPECPMKSHVIMSAHSGSSNSAMDCIMLSIMKKRPSCVLKLIVRGLDKDEERLVLSGLSSIHGSPLDMANTLHQKQLVDYLNSLET